MRRFFIGRPQGWGLWPELHEWSLPLLATAVVVTAAVVANNDRSAPEPVVSPSIQAAGGGTPLPTVPTVAPAPVVSVGSVAVAAAALAAAPDDKPTLRDAIALVEESRAALAGVHDYTAEFTKDELIRGRLRTQVMDIKVREKPFSVYLHYRSKKESGRQALFVEGRDDDALLVRDVGLKRMLGTMKLSLQNPMVTCENRHPVTELGISKVVETALAIWRREAKLTGTFPEVTICSSARFADADCCTVQVQYQKRLPALEFQKACVWFDRQTKLPLRAERYGWADEGGGASPLVEAYTYRNIQTNVGLTDADFDPRQSGF